MPKFSFRRFSIGFTLLLLIFLQPHFNCNSEKPGGESAKANGNNPLFIREANTAIWSPPSAPDQVLASTIKMKPNAVEIDESGMQYLEKADQKGGLYIFSDDADKVAKLSKGSFVFFKNHSVRRIVNIEKKDGKLLVRTAKCRFIDVFTDAHLHFKEKYDWRDNSTAMLEQMGFSFGEVAFAQDPISQSLSYEGTLRGYKIKIQLQPEGGRKLNFDISVKRESKANINFRGFITDFENETEVVVADSQLELFRSQNSNLRGEVEVKFAAIELGDEGELVNIPWTMFNRTILISGVPFQFKIKANVKVFPAIPSEASSQGHMKFTYASNTGFNYSGRMLKPEGNVTQQTFEVLGETLSAGTMGAGIGMGLEFPRFEIASLGEIIVPYFATNTYLDTQLDTYRPCQMGNMKGKLVAGLSLSFFGASYNAEKEMWSAKKRWEREGSNCPPDDL